MRADFVSIWLMVDYVYGNVVENASEMNVSLNVTVGEAMLWGVIFQNNGVGHGRGVTARRYVDEVLQSVLVPFMAGQRGMVFNRTTPEPTVRV